MLSILTTLLGFADPISKISRAIADARIAHATAVTDQEKIKADERIRALEYRRDVMVAESGSRINTFMRLAFAIPPAVYLAKLFIWDKVLGLGVTDPLSPMLEGIMWTVVGFYCMGLWKK